MFKKSIFFFFLTLFISDIQAQRGWEVGVMGGAMFYFGDLNTNFNLRHPGYAGSAVARYNFNNRLCVKASANLGLIKGNDAWSKNVFEQRRNLSFQSNIRDMSLQGEFNFLPYIHGSRTEAFSPYLMAGASVFGYNPTTDLNGELVELRPLGTEGQFSNNEYGTSALALLYGGGFKFSFSDKWSMNIEIAARKVYTDYIDDVSGVYPDVRDVKRLRGDIAASLVDRSGEPRIGKAGRQRGNGRNNDAYATINIGVLYYFGGLECPSLK
jgi:Domain of unknown function (DUF6089)